MSDTNKIDLSEINIPKKPKLSNATDDIYFCPTCFHGVGYILPSGKTRILERECGICGQKLKWYDGKDGEQE